MSVDDSATGRVLLALEAEQSRRGADYLRGLVRGAVTAPLRSIGAQMTDEPSGALAITLPSGPRYLLVLAEELPT